MRAAFAIVAACAALPACADQCQNVDASRATVSFELKQAGATFRGSFRRFGGEICTLADRVTKIEVWLEPASVDAGLPEINAALKEKEFFAVSLYPRAIYKASSVDARADAQLSHGVLQMKGKSRNLDVPFSKKREGAQQTLTGTIKLNRLDYDIGTGEWSNTQWLGNEVTLSFKVPLAGGSP